MIASHASELKGFGAKEFCLFGSFVSQIAKADSDVDILVTMDNVNYKQLSHLQLYLENLLHRKVDLIRKGPHLSSRFLSSIESEIIYV